MTRAQQLAYRFRGLLLAAGVLFALLGVTWLVLPCFNDILFEGRDDFAAFGLFGTPMSPGRLVDQDIPSYLANVSLVLGILLIAQWAFLRPCREWTVRLTEVGRPLKTAVFSAALIATLLTTGAVALLLEIPDWWSLLMGGTDNQPFAKGWGIAGVWTAMLIVWGLWTWVFFAYWRQGDRYTQMGRMIRGLVAGSLLEVFVAIPVHVWAMRQRECYCCRGTYTTLVFAGTVLLWVFGPGIILLYWREKYRRQKLTSRADVLDEVRD